MDIETLHQVMQQFLYTGIFQATVGPSQVFPEKGHIRLQVKEGIIYDCYFVNAQGKVQKLNRWNTLLTQLGVLNWQLTEMAPSEPYGQAAANTSPFDSERRMTSVPTFSSSPQIPYRAAIPLPVQLRQWPMYHRQVYSLIDGQRPLSDIAHILHKSPQEIERVIQDLLQHDFIKLR